MSMRSRLGESVLQIITSEMPTAELLLEELAADPEGNACSAQKGEGPFGRLQPLPGPQADRDAPESLLHLDANVTVTAGAAG